MFHRNVEADDTLLLEELVLAFDVQLGGLILTYPFPSTLPPPPPHPASRVEVRSVWASNLQEELSLISSLLPLYPGVCIDTEFPGTVHDSSKPRHLRTPEEQYAVVKKNVDGLQLIQLGLALFSNDDRFPCVWEFNFRDFDVDTDPHAPDSIALLRSHGMDFPQLREFGIDSRDFAAEFFRYGLARRCLTWVAFCGAYDFAYLLKVINGGLGLPDSLDEFLVMVRGVFGPRVLDVKHLARFCGRGIPGGLEKVAAALGVERTAGRAHNAGSDSLLACDVLRRMLSQFYAAGSVFVHMGAIEGFA